MGRGFGQSWVAAVACVASLAACTSSQRSDAHQATSIPAPVISAAGAGSAPAGTTPGSAAAPTDQAAIVSSLAPSVSASATVSAIARAAVTAKPAAPKPGPKPTASAKPAPPAAPQPLLVEQLASVGNAQQVVIVTSTSWSTLHATVQTFEKHAGTWRAVFPAMPAVIGRNGFSANRTEGDGTTPAGKYGFGTMFGQQPNPGVAFPYRRPDAQSVWVDDSTSPFYNTWQENAALSGEHLASASFARPYAYAVVIDFNSSPVVPHKGSAIFLHVSTGNGTAGCVSIAQPSLLQVLHWLDPAKAPVIVMGPLSVIRQY